MGKASTFCCASRVMHEKDLSAWHTRKIPDFHSILHAIGSLTPTSSFFLLTSSTGRPSTGISPAKVPFPSQAAHSTPPAHPHYTNIFRRVTSSFRSRQCSSRVGRSRSSNGQLRGRRLAGEAQCRWVLCRIGAVQVISRKDEGKGR